MEDLRDCVIFWTISFECKDLHLDRGWLGRITNCRPRSSTQGYPIPLASREADCPTDDLDKGWLMSLERPAYPPKGKLHTQPPFGALFFL